MPNVNAKDLGTGALFGAIGLIFITNALLTLELGGVGNMGPGYFPVLLGSLLIGLGAILAVRSIRVASDPIGRVPWKGIVLIALSIGIFGVAVRPLGLGPAFFGSTFLASLATERIKPLTALFVSLVLTVSCVVVFIYLLGLPYAVFGPWIRGY
jgi:hypothetical protein